MTPNAIAIPGVPSRYGRSPFPEITSTRSIAVTFDN
jgi:hypothetical protein